MSQDHDDTEQAVLMRPGDVGHAIRRRRQQRHMTQRELADASSVSRKWLSEIEHGKATAEIGRVISVLRALDCAFTLTHLPEPSFDLEAHIESFAGPRRS